MSNRYLRNCLTSKDRIFQPSELGGYYSGYWARLAQIHIGPPLRRPKADKWPKSSTDPHKEPTTSIIGSTRDQDHICTDLVRIYLLNYRNHHGYIKRRSALLQAPKSLFGDPSPTRYHSLIATLSLLPWHLRLPKVPKPLKVPTTMKRLSGEEDEDCIDITNT
ncbi:hypothetical protein PIB30_017722 [Stylosanthes scabra]|uniref:Uncharacterized protein n=1 Tax=Stylosanthes scabra TaxID=79078 RepID=A0ABU6R804_9FABA|nr:hypothetical protein [Stylosanthes scabra]